MRKIGLLLLVAICTGLCSTSRAEAMGFPVSTKHIRILGYGNRTSLWYSVSEVSFSGEGLSMEGVKVSARSDGGNTAENTVDGDLETFWSGHGMGEPIRYDFPEPQAVSGVDIAFYLGDKRRAYFAVEISGDGLVWQRIFYGTSSGKTTEPETFRFTEAALMEVTDYKETGAESFERLAKLQERMLPKRGTSSWEDKHLGLVTLYLDRFKQGRLGIHPGRDRDLLPEVRQAMDALERNEDFLGSLEGEHWCAHYANADRSGMPFVLSVPKGYDRTGSYPLVVELHGWRVRPTPRPGTPDSLLADHFHARPVNRGDTFYLGLGEVTVNELIDYMLRNYPIDRDRVNITGESMGGGGTWNMATNYPYRFASAAPIYGYAEGTLLQNLQQVPVWNSHGLRDFRVNVGSSHYAVGVLRTFGKSIKHTEYPESGHSARDMQMPWQWQIAHRNEGRDISFSHTTEHPLRGRHYWSRMVQATDPHAPSVVTADVERGGIALELENVAVLEVTPARLPSGTAPDRITVAGAEVKADEGFPGEAFFLVNRNSKWRLATGDPFADGPRAYAPGGAGNLYAGEPMLVVYGTRAGKARTAALEKLAEAIAFRCHPGATATNNRSMIYGGFPIKPDHEVSGQDQKEYNLVIVGGPDENALAAKYWEKLPVRHPDQSIEIDGLDPLPRKGSALSFLHYNPSATQRLIYCVDTGGLETSEIARRTKSPGGLLPGMSLSNPISTPDLMVARGDTLLRMMQYGADWKLISGPDYQVAVPASLCTDSGLAKHYADAIHEACGADFGVYPGHRREIRPLLHQQYSTLGDWRVFKKRYPAFIGTIDGEVLEKMVKVLIPRGHVTLSPMPDSIQADRKYTVASFPWLPRRLNALKENCGSVEIGPEIGAFLLDGAFGAE